MKDKEEPAKTMTERTICINQSDDDILIDTSDLDDVSVNAGSPGTEKIQLEAGRILKNKYRLEERVGRGGMGEVWRAQDVLGNREVALKFVPRDIQKYNDEMQRVKDTFRAVHSLNHQHICPVYALEEDKDHGYYLVMKWLRGKSLVEVQRRNADSEGRLSTQLIPRLLEPIALALDYAHLHGVIHRDVKPGNVAVNIVGGKIDEIYLIDFGLASAIMESMTRISQARTETSGTPSYMPPEQWRGRRQDARTDQYSLGVMAYELYAGHLPFSGTGFEILRAAILRDPPERITNIPAGINDVLQKALAKDRMDRFNNCTEFVNALKQAALPKAYPVVRDTDDTHRISNPTGNIPSQITQQSTFSKTKEEMILIALTAVALLALLVTVVYSLWPHRKTPHTPGGEPVAQQLEPATTTAINPVPSSEKTGSQPPAGSSSGAGETNPNESGSTSGTTPEPSALAGLPGTSGPSVGGTDSPSAETPEGTVATPPVWRSVDETLRTIPLINCRGQITNDEWKTIQSQKKPFRVDLGYIPILDADMKKLEGLEHSVGLNLEMGKFSDMGLASLATLPQLVQLNLRRNTGKITDSGLEHLDELTKLRSLNLEGNTSFTDSGLAILRNFKELEYLNLNDCVTISDATIPHMVALKELRYLNLGNNKLITDTGIARLARLSNLETLILDYAQLTDKGLDAIARLEKLRNISIAGTEIDDVGLIQFLRQTSNLRSLNIGQCSRISDGALSHVAPMRSLEELSLSPNTTDSGIVQLSSLINLQILDLTNCKQITNAGLSPLAAMTRLNKIVLTETNITEQGLVHLASLPELQELDLSGCKQFSDSSVNTLSKMNRLRKLTIRGTQITPAGRQQLTTTLPRVTITL